MGPGAFNLFSGLAVALADSYPVPAITGYVELDWRGRGAVNDTSGRNRTPDSQAVFAATTKKSYLLTDVADTCEVLEGRAHLGQAHGDRRQGHPVGPPALQQLPRGRHPWLWEVLEERFRHG
ncbi:hypothetical protein ACF1BE_31970 [Streptomyces sp. NPDC014991]|uniref:hypothetical protein n=1 Tax=Streptomyces sp. NPDC014991 TaxID=3364935 RepID=UPI0036FA1054